MHNRHKHMYIVWCSWNTEFGSQMYAVIAPLTVIKVRMIICSRSIDRAVQYSNMELFAYQFCYTYKGEAILAYTHCENGIDSIEGASKVIEHCHRIGPFQQGKTRAIIANIYSRPLRNQLLKDARDVNNNSNNDIYIAPDMTKLIICSNSRPVSRWNEPMDKGKRSSSGKGNS